MVGEYIFGMGGVSRTMLKGLWIGEAGRLASQQAMSATWVTCVSAPLDERCPPNSDYYMYRNE